jgi:radical SAM superfamily enzyme YgiQ (UPF0313 family)
MRVEPLELEAIAATISPKDKVLIVDMILEDKPIGYFIREYNPEVFCTTGYITHVPIMRAYCREAKKIDPAIKTIVGGVHVEKFPGDLNDESIDYRVVRNAIKVFPELIEHIKNNTLLPQGVLSINEKLNGQLLPEFNFEFPYPRRDLTERYRKKYFYVFHNKVALIKTSFGCPYKCNFCFCRKITNDNYFVRPMENVIEELKSISEEEIYVVDDNFLYDGDKVQEFINALKANKIHKKYLVYGRADFIASNAGLLEEFHRWGLKTIIVGLESFNNSELNSYHKRTDLEINKACMDILNRTGIDCYAAFILPPEWDTKDFQIAAKYINELKIRFLNLQPLCPLPGIDMDFSEKDLLIDRTDFARWDLAHVTIKPERLSVKEYYDQMLSLYKRTVYRPENLISLLKYPLLMQWKIHIGLVRILNQYKKEIMSYKHYA